MILVGHLSSVEKFLCEQEDAGEPYPLPGLIGRFAVVAPYLSSRFESVLSDRFWNNIRFVAEDFYRDALCLFYFIYYLEWMFVYLGNVVRSCLEYIAAAFVSREMIDTLPVMNN
ncbi:hypothetical protein [Niveispirillum cyanobacteriorum]|uniref:hypothetical protein n=1 Tax=Niveispirillum cyanobacteriorum TaxID=1612173 RepID=UPI001319E48E|nr:hypothetical protein [Niveispirillum cyanobacteriorum]GGE55980.1 hypothetical protein GCM10011317_12510 [Niveispirillum cyanobacteriorum]